MTFRFDMLTDPSPHLTQQAAKIHETYFTVDTAEMPLVWQWLRHNPYTDTYALRDGRVIGFFNVLPLTSECGALFEREAIREEDLSIEHILPHESLPHARYAYIAAIAVENIRTHSNCKCVAAMITSLVDLLLYGYQEQSLQKIFANPTTFRGNKLVRKLGFQPLDPDNKILGLNDIYVLEQTTENRARLKTVADRYRHFVGTNPWAEKSM